MKTTTDRLVSIHMIINMMSKPCDPDRPHDITAASNAFGTRAMKALIIQLGNCA
jgi:hypothetical protein